MQASERHDVVVIGAGVAGLAASIEAAEAGARVTVLEARATLGGRARTHRRDGYALNEGAHALYVDGPASAFLRELGCEPGGGVPDVGTGVGVDGDRTGVFPAGVVSLLRTPLLKGDRLAMAKLFAKLPRLDAAAYATTTVNDAIDDLLGRGPAARMGLALFRLATYFDDPARTSADAGLSQLQMVLGNGVRYIDGGWQVMVDGLEKAARDRGVQIHTGAKVERLERSEIGHAVATGDARHDAAAVVIAGSAHLVASLAGPHAPATRGWAAAARPASVACLDVGLAAEWGEHPPFALGIDEPTYLSVHAPVADLAPPGHSLVHVMRYHPADESPDPERDRIACEALLDRVRPGWRDVADHVAFAPRLIASTDQPAAASGGLAGRPPVRVPGATGLFVAGDWVGPTGVLVDAAVASGRAAGRAAAA